MKTQDIKNMGQALQQVQESAKAALAKKLAKASASSEKGKAAVTLPKAPFDIPKKGAKDEGYGSMVSPAAKKAIDARVAANTAALKAKGKNADGSPMKKEALKGDQHKLDRDDDGDIDAADLARLRKKKKGEKSEVKPRQEPDGEKTKANDAPMEKTEGKVSEVSMDTAKNAFYKRKMQAFDAAHRGDSKLANKLADKKNKTKAYIAKRESVEEATMDTKWPVYARMMEKAAHKGGTAPEEMDSKDSPSAKKMKKDHKPEVNDTEAKGHVDAAEAGRKGPSAKARPNDNMKGDKNVVNPVKGAETNGKN